MTPSTLTHIEFEVDNYFPSKQATSIDKYQMEIVFQAAYKDHPFKLNEEFITDGYYCGSHYFRFKVVAVTFRYDSLVSDLPTSGLLHNNTHIVFTPAPKANLKYGCLSIGSGPAIPHQS